MTELPKTFDPAEIESRWYARWEGEGLFRPERPEAEPFTIVIPPPNVTGSLHIGHALDITLQDVLVRHARLQGKDALWVVGTDHAGIATQMVVERNLDSQGVKRTDMSRDAFIEHVWEWKAQSGGAITRQLRRLGASCDWANERFTMDPGFSAAVLKVFVHLYREGLLYRDKRLVNWDPRFGTAISDLEVETKEVQGQFWHLRYPLEDGSGFVHVATTRPETMLADMAVAVHPTDKRYTQLVGKRVRLPLTGRLVPIIADEHADPELGSGAVKITPGHDFNDFEVGRRAGFKAAEMLNMLSADAKVMQTRDGLVPDALLGLDRFEARKRVVELLEEKGFLEGVEDRTIQIPYGDRSGVVIEPWLTDQWYVDAKTLAGPAIEAVRSGDIKVVPRTWEKTWFNWLENIQPWCVSRQLWWGHQIPAWYDDEGNVFVAETEDVAQREAGNRPLRRDPDVLDTWFSSALWPFATLGWPADADPIPLSPAGIAATGLSPGQTQESPQWQGEGVPTPEGASDGRAPSPQPSPPGGEGVKWRAKPGTELARHYPNDVLISGFDIIFFWDARMAMQGLHFLGERPWKTLYLHGLVRDAKGQKMSKSKGNAVDPIGLVDRYGADALRFTLAAMESQGRDIKLDEKRVEGYRNFATKLWNAARFCQANGIGASAALEPPEASLPVNRWIIGETVKTVQALDLSLAELRYDESANGLYHFVWATFCDWYLELIKGQVDDETKAVAAWVLDQILVMLHPFMPFITEELWNANERPYPLILARWPMPDARALDPEASAEVSWLIDLVILMRSGRNELNVPPGAIVPLRLGGKSKGIALERIVNNKAILRRLARVEFGGFGPLERETDFAKPHWDELAAKYSEEVQTGSLYLTMPDFEGFLPLEGVIDIAAERARLAKAAEAAEKERDSLAARLANPSFVERAKPAAVEKARADHAEKASDADKYRAALARLG
jgi:valyl-tRNA synthetase